MEFCTAYVIYIIFLCTLNILSLFLFPFEVPLRKGRRYNKVALEIIHINNPEYILDCQSMSNKCGLIS